MKFTISFLFCFLFVASGLSQQTRTDTVFSRKLNEERLVTISLPPSYDRDKDRKFPMLFLLDGAYLLPAFKGALDYGNYWEDLPEMIVVALHQNSNQRELDCTIDSQTGLPEGRGNHFFDFIGMELVPAIEKKYRVAPLKIAAGHDVTAGFLNFFLYKDVPLFDGYILFSPELSQGMETHVAERLAAIQKPLMYYHCTADGDLKKIATKARALDEKAKVLKRNGLNYRFDDFIGASHYSLVLYGIPNALYQFFSIFQPISTTEFNEKIAVLTEGYVKYLTDKYTTIEKAMGTKMTIRLNDFKAIEAAILKNKAYHEFDALSDVARKQYPKSMLADYHMAQMYEKQGDNKRAIKAYMNAYQKQEIGDLTKDLMLERADELKR